MQIDFCKCVPDAQDFAGWLEKKGSVRKNWKRRYFILSNGLLKYYNKEPSGNGIDSEQKGEVTILGAIVTISEGSQIHITNKNDKRHSNTFTLKAKSASEATSWNDALCVEIERINIIAIQNGSRVPEVVEWYYQHQSDVTRRNAFLSKEVIIDLHYAVPGRMGAQSVSKFSLTMTADKQGLLLRINVTNGKKFNRIESLNNGRVLLFHDIIGALLPSGTWEVKSGTPFAFTLLTHEDQLSMEMSQDCNAGPDWLLAVQDMASFSHIPKPISRSMSSVMYETANENDNSSSMNAIFEFSTNSGAVFASSSDVQLIIEGFSALTAKSPVVLDIGKRVNVILKLIPDMKCNKEAALNFGDRIEDFVRVLGDQDNGIVYLASEWDKALLNQHLTTFSNKLNDIALYLHTQCKAGWLAMCLSRPGESAQLRFETFDGDLIAILNTLCKAMSLPASMMFDKKDYSMAVDVRRSVEALGGVEAVYRDVAKERALARLVQADGHEISVEVEAIMHAEGIMSRSHGAQRVQSASFSSYQSSIDIADRGSVSCFRRYFCCCLQNPRRAKYGTGSLSLRKSNNKLDEPLVY